ncbi:MAG: GNAT family N-acetyltransferase [Betaproteobacteria bacterium]
MIKLRLDVDYPYPSRLKSFLHVALRIKSKKSQDYLRNACIIARMVNESPRQIKAYWFFTPYTIPNKRLLDLLNPEKHEVDLHVANKPSEEWKTLEKETDRKVQYYTIHGTERLFAKLIWGRKLSQSQAIIPADFALGSFDKFFKNFSLDRIRYDLGFEKAVKGMSAWFKEDIVLSIHPEWLFEKTDKGRRGPYYDLLKNMLDVDQELDTLRTSKKVFFKIGRDIHEYEKSINPTEAFLSKLSERGIDVYTFLDRKWCCPIVHPSPGWVGEDDNVGLLKIRDFNSWLQIIGKKTRNMVRKAEKSGVKVGVVEPSDKLAEGIWKIYNETPIRQERAFTHYGESLATVTDNMYAAKNNTFIAASLEGELVGFIQILYGDQVAIVSNILSLQSHWDKALNNAMLAKAVEVCAAKGERWLMYGRIGNHPSLDKFKENNGFVKFPITRYYVPLTSRGRLAIKLGLHRDFKDSLPDFIKYPLIPTINLISRNKVKAKMKLRKMKG